MAPSISVAEYYAGKNIFITGATGFVGKVLVEKLLRSCPDVGNIYVMVRPKKGKTVKERFNEFIECPIFDYIREHSANSIKKLKVVPGDILKDNLGLSEDDRSNLQSECQVVFHSAACVRFDMPLREAVEQNVKPTKRILELAEGIHSLEVMVHVSTSYCQTEKVILEEKIYPAPMKPQLLMDFVDSTDEHKLSSIEARLIHPYGNTYGYTKAVSEELVAQYQGKFPIAIARPSIVSASIKEPMPGWVDNINGPTGVLLAGGKGVLRSMICYSECVVDGMPLDLVVNACIVLAYMTALERPREVRVCNITQSGLNARNWEDCKQKTFEIIPERPFSQALWVPGGSAKRSRLHHDVVAFFCHCIPAYFIDCLLFLLGKKTFMVAVYKRIKDGISVLEYYLTKQWRFKNDYFLSLQTQISEEDNNTFYTDIKLLDWDVYLYNYLLGIQKYICKEDPANLQNAKRLYKILWYADKILKIALYSFFVYLAYKVISIVIC